MSGTIEAGEIIAVLGGIRKVLGPAGKATSERSDVWVGEEEIALAIQTQMQTRISTLIVCP